MNPFERLRAVLPVRSSRVVRECRRCGATVERGDGACPYCGPGTDVVEYEVG